MRCVHTCMCVCMHILCASACVQVLSQRALQVASRKACSASWSLPTSDQFMDVKVRGVLCAFIYSRGG